MQGSKTLKKVFTEYNPRGDRTQSARSIGNNFYDFYVLCVKNSVECVRNILIAF